MADTTTTTDSVPELEAFEDLKQQARLLGIKFSNNIGYDALAEKVKAKLETPTDAPIEADHIVNSDKRKEALKLVRCRITNRNPAKQGQSGTVITCAAPNTGIVRKYIPFEGHEDGWHVPQIILDFLRQKKFLRVWTEPDPNNRQKMITRTAQEDEYIIEILPPLTQEELDKLALEQKSTGLI